MKYLLLFFAILLLIETATADYTVGAGGSIWDGNASWDINTTYNEYDNDGNIILNQIFSGWLVHYNASVLPNLDGWTLYESGTPDKSVSSGKFYYNSSGGDILYYQRDWNANNTDGWTIEWRAKCINTSDYGFEFRTRDGTRYEDTQVETYPSGRVVFIYAGQSYSMSTTDKYHTYRMTYKGNAIKMYVDGTLKIDTTSTSSTSGNNMNFGDIGTGESSFGKVYIDYIKYYVGDVKIPEYNSSGNLTTWHDAGSGNETYQIIVNCTTPTNTNYTVYYRENNTGDYVSLASAQSGNQTISISGTKYQNTDIRVKLIGNATQTPELIGITFETQASGAAGSPSITYYTPTETIWPEVADSQMFNVTTDQTTNCTWYINGSQVQYNTSSTEHTYTNTSLKGGYWNFTAVVNNANGTNSQTWLFEVGADSIDTVILSEDDTNLSCLIRWNVTCLLYTSDAADELDGVDRGGRRII